MSSQPTDIDGDEVQAPERRFLVFKKRGDPPTLITLPEPAEPMPYEDLIKIRMDHSRELFKHSASHRLKAFDFFLVYSGLLVVAFGLTQRFKDLHELGAVIGLLGVGAVIGFIALDHRCFDLVKDASKYLQSVEKSVGLSIIADGVVKGRNQPWYTHGFAFRTIQGTLGAAWVGGIVWVLTDRDTSTAGLALLVSLAVAFTYVLHSCAVPPFKNWRLSLREKPPTP